MTTTTIYDPCGSCAGRGSVQIPNLGGTGPSGAWMRCEFCGGSGKGRVREIREVREPVYPDPWPVNPVGPNTCGGIPGSVAKDAGGGG